MAVRVTLGAVNALHVNPAGIVSVRATVPTKLNELVKVKVAVRDPTGPVGEEATMLKSPTWIVADAE